MNDAVQWKEAVSSKCGCGLCEIPDFSRDDPNLKLAFIRPGPLYAHCEKCKVKVHNTHICLGTDLGAIYILHPNGSCPRYICALCTDKLLVESNAKKTTASEEDTSSKTKPKNGQPVSNNKKGKAQSNPHWTQEEESYLLDVVASVLPANTHEWKVAYEKFVANRPSNLPVREFKEGGKSLKKRFYVKMANVIPESGDSDMPEHIRRAKEIKRDIENKQAVGRGDPKKVDDSSVSSEDSNKKEKAKDRRQPRTSYSALVDMHLAKMLKSRTNTFELAVTLLEAHKEDTIGIVVKSHNKIMQKLKQMEEEQYTMGVAVRNLFFYTKQKMHVLENRLLPAGDDNSNDTINDKDSLDEFDKMAVPEGYELTKLEAMKRPRCEDDADSSGDADEDMIAMPVLKRLKTV